MNDQEKQQLADEIVEAASILAAQNLSDSDLTEGIAHVARHAAKMTGRTETAAFVASSIRAAIESQRSVAAPPPTQKQTDRAASELNQQDQEKPQAPSSAKAEKTAAKNLDQKERESLPSAGLAKEAQEHGQQRLTTPREKKIGEDNPHLPSRQGQGGGSGASAHPAPSEPDPVNPSSQGTEPSVPDSPKQSEQPAKQDAPEPAQPTKDAPRDYSDQQKQDFEDLKNQIGPEGAHFWLKQQSPEGPPLEEHDPGQVAPAIIDGDRRDASPAEDEEQPKTHPPQDGEETAAPQRPRQHGATEEQPSQFSSALDVAQYAADAVGVVDPTGLVDSANALVSFGRMFTDPKRAKMHGTNALISAAGVVPYVGDLAKIAKAPRAAKAFGRLGGSSARKSAAKMRNRGAAMTLASALGIDGADGINAGGGGGEPPVSDDGGDNGGRDGDGRGAQELDFFSSLAGKMAGVVGGIVGSLVLFGTAITKSIAKLQSINEGVLSQNKDLAQYSGGVANAYGRYEADEIRRKIERGEQLAGPLQELARSQSELKQVTEEFTVPVKALLIQVLAEITKMVSDTAEGAAFVAKLDPRVQTIVDILDWFRGKDDQNHPGGIEFLRDVADGKLDGKFKNAAGQFEILPGLKGLTPQEMKDLYG